MQPNFLTPSQFVTKPKTITKTGRIISYIGSYLDIVVTQRGHHPLCNNGGGEIKLCHSLIHSLISARIFAHSDKIAHTKTFKLVTNSSAKLVFPHLVRSVLADF